MKEIEVVDFYYYMIKNQNGFRYGVTYDEKSAKEYIEFLKKEYPHFDFHFEKDAITKTIKVKDKEQLTFDI